MMGLGAAVQTTPHVATAGEGLSFLRLRRALHITQFLPRLCLRLCLRLRLRLFRPAPHPPQSLHQLQPPLQHQHHNLL